MNNEEIKIKMKEITNELPEYYLGRLILYEALSKDACKWVVYDGVTKVRCASKQSAMRYCEDHSVNIPYKLQEGLTSAYTRMQHAVSQLESVAEKYGGSHSAYIHSIAITLRLLSDRVDTLIKQIHPIL